MSEAFERMRDCLKEMFQFDNSDLDFGIYKIYRLKNKEILSFIEGDDKASLGKIVEDSVGNAFSAQKEAQLITLRNFINDHGGKDEKDWLENIPGNLAKIRDYINYKKPSNTKELLEVLARQGTNKSFDAKEKLIEDVYNYIINFFELYYSNGDFGYNARSSSPFKVAYDEDYDGSDTMFFWKHKGSLYIKSANTFNGIKFTVQNKELEYVLETPEKDEEEDKPKDAKLKHFKLNRIYREGNTWKISFNLSDKSTPKPDVFKSVFKDVFNKELDDKYLFAEIDGKKVSIFKDLEGDDFDKVEGGAAKGISKVRVSKEQVLNKINSKIWKDARIDEKDTTFSLIYSLDYRLNNFYIGIDSDFFIHEDLKGFLSREKDKFIKNHIFNDLDSLLNLKVDNTTIVIANAFDKIVSRLIEFLSAIEEFQKKLFKFRKKAINVNYCLTIDNLNESYYDEILRNKSQVEEWEKLFSVTVKNNEDLRNEPTLTLDTKFFPEEFKEKIISEISDLDNKINGVLINSENYQALNLLKEKYRGKIKCIYIDPPYNTGSDEFIYKDRFRHSSWCSMMQNRLEIARDLLLKYGLILIHIDEHESYNLNKIINQVFSESNLLGEIIWDKRNPKGDAKGIAVQNEKIVVAIRDSENLIESDFRKTKENADKILEKAKKIIGNNKTINDKIRKEFKEWIDKQPFAEGEILYNLIDDNGGVYRCVSMAWPNKKRAPDEYFSPLIHPITKKACPVPERGWRNNTTTMAKYLKDGLIIFGPNESIQPQRKYLLKENMTTNVPSILYFGGSDDEAFNNFGLTFDNPKPVEFSKSLLSIGSRQEESIIIDFFGGSGTSAHAMISLNKKEKINRKYILVEQDKWFNSVLLPRVRKIIYSENWKGGKPIDNQGATNHIFKYFELEQYEDVLDAIEADTVKKSHNPNIPLKYLYLPETLKLENSLDLRKPFSCEVLHGRDKSKSKADLVETYNYLQGYCVDSVKSFKLHKKKYRVVKAGTRLVLWREIEIAEDDVKNIKELVLEYTKEDKDAIETVEVNAEISKIHLDRNDNLDLGNGQKVKVEVFNKEIFFTE